MESNEQNDGRDFTLTDTLKASAAVEDLRRLLREVNTARVGLDGARVGLDGIEQRARLALGSLRTIGGVGDAN